MFLFLDDIFLSHPAMVVDLNRFEHVVQRRRNIVSAISSVLAISSIPSDTPRASPRCVWCQVGRSVLLVES